MTRIPPHNVEAELSVLGAMLLGDKSACADAAEVLVPEDFYRDTHTEIFAAMLDLLTDSEPIDPVTLRDRLTQRGTLDQIGGVGYLLQLGEVEFTTAHIAYYAAIVKDHSTKRGLIAFASSVAARAYEPTDDSDGPCQIEEASRALFALGEGASATGEGPQKAYAATNRYLEDLTERRKSGNGFRGTRTGFPELDGTLRGFRPGFLYVLAARPSMGKSAMAGSLLLNIARRAEPVLFFSLEMPSDDVTMRLISAEARVNSDRLEEADFDKEQSQRIRDSAAHLREMPYYLDDESDISATQIEARTRRILAQEKGLGLVIVDYLQIMKTEQKENRNVEVGAACKALKNMAKRLKVPVLVLSQLSRANERRPDKRPILSDLRESGDIEAVADAVIFLHRPAYYDRDATPVTEGAYEKAEILIPKHRNGKTGDVNLGFAPHFTRFGSLAPDYFKEGF